MSDKISGFTVVFKDSVREEYMNRVKEAIQLFDGVAIIEPLVEDTDTFIGQSKESYRIKSFLIDAIKNDFK